jgi:RNA polymerase sigma-70 factor (ECF subfamily)
MSSSTTDLVPPSSGHAPHPPVGANGVAAPALTTTTAVRAWSGAPRGVDAERRSDATLMEQARAGDADAFAVVYGRHASAAYSLARRMMQAPGAAQDVVQESFLALWRSDSYCADKGSLRSFVLGIVRNRAIDELRKQRRRSTQERSDEVAVLGLSASDRTDVEVEQRDAQRLLRAALASLPDAQHQALELAFFEGLTYAEIARRLNAPIGTIKGRIRLGLQKLRKEIDVASYR